MRNVETSKRRNVEASRRNCGAGGMVAALGLTALGLVGQSNPPMSLMDTGRKGFVCSSVLSGSSVLSLVGAMGVSGFGHGLVLASTEGGATGDGGREASVDPYEAVRQGNELLKQDKPREALRYYELAAKEKPDAREIAFAEGLAQYHLGDYEKARELFRRAADGRNDALADDAMYSLGTTYHGDALLSRDDPKAALGLLEEAMQHYQSVLGHRPDHEAARDAYRKAGTMWRFIKEQMEQQPQQQQPDDPDQDGEDEQEQDEPQRERDQQEEQDQNEDQNRQDQRQESDDPSDEQPQPSPSDEQGDQEQEREQQEQSAADPEENEEEQPQAAPDQQDQQELVSREQAERKLREMMHALRERRENRREPEQTTPAQAVEKDW